MHHRVILLGRLGRNPERRYSPDGTPVAVFSIAVNRRYSTQDGQRVEETLWFRVTAWGPLADVAQHLHKGDMVYVEGRLVPGPGGNPRLYRRSDGTMGASYDLRAQVLRLLSPRQDGDAETGPRRKPENIPTRTGSVSPSASQGEDESHALDADAPVEAPADPPTWVPVEDVPF